MTLIRRRLLAGVVATGAMALAAPLSVAGAAIIPPVGFPVAGGNAIGGNAIGSAGCVGTNRPAVGGNNGSTSAQACGGGAYQGPHIGQISGEPAVGPTVINSPFTAVNVASGSITAAP